MNSRCFINQNYVDYECIPDNLPQKMINTLKNIGIVKYDKIAFVIKNDCLIMPLLLSFDGISCCIDLININSMKKSISSIINKYNLIFSDFDLNLQIPMYCISDQFNCCLYIYEIKNECIDNKQKVIDNEIAFFSSGTTGTPKRMVLKREKIIMEAKILVEQLKIRNYDTILCVAPCYHKYAQVFACFCAAIAHAKVKYLPAFTLPNRILAELNNNAYTILVTTPYYYDKLYDKLLAHTELRYMFSAGAHLSEKVINSGIHINNIYATTETGVIAIQTYHNNLCTAKSSGQALPCIDILFDELVRIQNNIKMRRISVNTPYGIDKLYIDGKLYYVDCPIKLNDYGYFNDNNELVIVGRTDDILNINGEKVSCVEIEQVLLSFHGIKEVKVSYLNNLKQIVAYMVIDKNLNLTKNQLRAFCKQRLEDYKIPKKFYVLKQLEKTETGKIKNEQKNIAEL